MRILRYLTAIFIDTFGITHPSMKDESRAVWYITSLLVLVFLMIGGLILAVAHLLKS
jgi:hypothetical protein